MVLIDYEYYVTKYMGDIIPEASFLRMADNASSKVNYFTFNRIKESNLNDLIRNTICKVAELLFEQHELKNKILSTSEESGDIASESLGPHSISYVNKSTVQANLLLSEQELDKKVYSIIYKDLVHTGLLNRGVYHA